MVIKSEQDIPDLWPKDLVTPSGLLQAWIDRWETNTYIAMGDKVGNEMLDSLKKLASTIKQFEAREE